MTLCWIIFQVKLIFEILVENDPESCIYFPDKKRIKWYDVEGWFINTYTVSFTRPNEYIPDFSKTVERRISPNMYSI